MGIRYCKTADDSGQRGQLLFLPRGKRIMRMAHSLIMCHIQRAVLSLLLQNWRTYGSAQFYRGLLSEV
eukprot:1098107-Amphidinium_carterae.2